jgi:transposase
MPWKEICSMDERMSVLTQVNDSEESFAALCRRFGISRKTGYKWVERYEGAGPAGLSDRRPRAISHPARVPESQIDELVCVRRDHPFWGPKKILTWLEEHRPEKTWPAASTIGDTLKSRGYIRPRRRRLRVPMSLDPLAAALAWPRRGTPGGPASRRYAAARGSIRARRPTRMRERALLAPQSRCRIA